MDASIAAMNERSLELSNLDGTARLQHQLCSRVRRALHGDVNDLVRLSILVGRIEQALTAKKGAEDVSVASLQVCL
jgi:hypothetical protein